MSGADQNGHSYCRDSLLANASWKSADIKYLWGLKRLLKRLDGSSEGEEKPVIDRR